MKNSSLFQTILLIVFGGALLIGILIFSGILPGFKAKPIGVAGTVTMWGTISEGDAAKFIETLNKEGEGKFQLVYVPKDLATIGDDLLEALASDNAPDLAILPQDLIFRHRDKLYPVPFTSVTKRQYEDSFVDGTKIFETGDGYLALPVAVDPLVLYYNKDLYKAANIVNPPASWEEFVLNQPKLTIFDDLNRITQSALALGTSNNINNAKNIFSLLSMQSGAKPVEFDGASLYPNLTYAPAGSLSPSQMSLDFYNQFSDPKRSTYCWNRSLPLDRDYFLSGKLANYFGLSSDLAYILGKNPHLNFDTASVPRLNKGENLTLGNFYGLAILKRTSKVATAFSADFSLVFGARDQELSQLLGLVPVKRSAIQAGDPDPKRQIFLNEALVSSAWADPASKETTAIISGMIDDSSSGRLSSAQAVKKANDELQVLLKNPR